MLRSVAVTTWLAETCGFKINKMGSDLTTVVVKFWVSKWFGGPNRPGKQVRSRFPLPFKCTASTVLGLKKYGFGDVGFDVLGVVVFVPPIFLLWPMFSVNFMGLF